MQDNAIIIKLEDGDITTAQDDPDIEGIIHIPSIEYDHLVQEVQVPGQEFFNGLYINVQDLEIGGSGLPIILNNLKLNLNDGMHEDVDTRDFTILLRSQHFDLSNQCLITIRDYGNDYLILFYNTYGISQQITVSSTNNMPTRFYLFTNSAVYNPVLQLFSNTNKFLETGDVVPDSNGTLLKLRKNYVEFDWGNN